MPSPAPARPPPWKPSPGPAPATTAVYRLQQSPAAGSGTALSAERGRENLSCPGVCRDRRRYQRKLVGKLRPLDLFAPLKLEHLPFADAYTFAAAVLETLNRFLASAAPALTLAQVPPHFCEAGESLLASARRLWSLMGDPDNPVGMVHDGYLKLFQLSQPVLTGFDYILFDEAQDANPAMLDIVQRQSMPQVIVGDRHQQIYGWRGAQNALDALQPTTTRYLTRSFRFGPPIAALANVLLATYKGETVAVVGQRDSGRRVTFTVAVSIP